MASTSLAEVKAAIAAGKPGFAWAQFNSGGGFSDFGWTAREGGNAYYGYFEYNNDPIACRNELIEKIGTNYAEGSDWGMSKGTYDKADFEERARYYRSLTGSKTKNYKEIAEKIEKFIADHPQLL
ncbi:MAG: hypothetical protein R3F55_21465 [Alphaproteobacteria bacterium]